MFDKMPVLFAEVRMLFNDCQGHLEFRPAPGNAGTGKCQRGAFEHGCEFAPVAGMNNIYNEILSAPCRFYVASVIDGQCSASVKATERQFVIKQKRYLRTAGISVHIIQQPFAIQT